LTLVAVSIKDPDTDHLIRELARRTGETQVRAVRTAVAERLARLERDQAGPEGTRRERLQAIAQDTAPRLAGTTASMDIGSYLYDDQGLPG
jgi:antitoxin VapB